MMAMTGSRILVECMTLQADAFACDPKLRTVRLVAITAGDASGEHLTLLEGGVIIGFFHIAHLAVGKIGARRQRLDHMGLRQPLAGNPVFMESAAARVAQSTTLDLLAKRGRRDTAVRVAGVRINRPGHIAALVETDEQSLVQILALAKRPPALSIARPGSVG